MSRARHIRAVRAALALLAAAGAARAEEPIVPPIAVEPPSPSEDAGATAVLNKWILAIGGPYELEELRTLDSHSKVDFGNGAPAIDVHLRALARGRCYRYDFALPVYGTLTQAYDGQSTWQRNEQLGVGPLTALDHQLNFLSSDMRAPMRIGAVFPRRRQLPDATIDGQRRQVVELATRAGRVEKWYFDPVTGYRVRIEVAASGETVTIDFDDFRNAFGARVKEPYRIVRRHGARRIETTMQVILYNEDMDSALFAPPLSAVQDNAEIERVLYFNARFRGAGSTAEVGTRVAEQEVAVTTTGLRYRRTVYQKRPNLIAIEEDLPGIGKAWQGYDGKTGWAWNEVEGFREMGGAELQQMLGSADFDGPVRLSETCPLRRWLGDKEVGGRRLVGIGLATVDGPVGEFYFDPRTCELVQLVTQLQAGANGRLKVLAEFGDYRAVGGFVVPFSTIVSTPAMRSVLTTRTLRHNVPLDNALFKPRRE